MNIFAGIRGQFIDVIEWLDSSNDTIAYRFERHNNEIKMGAKLTVRPGQVAVFVNEGQVADVFHPGRHELSTQNLPILSTLMGWKYGFQSPFKAEVYFFNAKVFTNLKWGTSNPITIRDPELGPVRLRAYGNYSIRVSNPTLLLTELVSTDGLFQVDEISDHFRNIIITSFASWVGQDTTPLLDFAANYRQMGERIKDALQADLQSMGVTLTQLLIENISLPPEVETALDKRVSMGLIGNMQQYTQFQAANAIEESAKNPSSGGNPGLDFGFGIVMAQEFAGNMRTSPSASTPTSPTTPPPPPVQTQWYISRDGQNVGPFNLTQLQQQNITGQTYVWHQGMSDWQYASEIPELKSLFNSPPPPPPPPPPQG